MTRSALAVASLLGAAGFSGWPQGAPARPGRHHHQIATANAEAQMFFDQGLTLVYGFNHGGAIRMFRRAAELDPAAPMPLWGIALALGPHINNPDVDPESERNAAATIHEASVLADRAGSPNERAYIEALSTRYSGAPDPDLRKLDRAYADAMARLARQYPDDLDAQTLYAESLMDLRPWALWSQDGTPSDVTPQILSIFESVLQRDPAHAGANHYYIHAVEASPHPEKALAAARQLETLVPDAGHLVHMPAHIYMRTGDFDAAARSNAQAAATDERYIQQAGSKTGLYPLMYYNHNVHFESAAECMAGRYADAKRSADKLVANVSPYVSGMPMLEAFIPQAIVVLARFNRWDDLLALLPPPADHHLTTAFWRYARAIGCAARHDVPGARRERQAFLAVTAAVPRDAPFGINDSGPVFDVARAVIEARLAMAEHGAGAAIPLWEAAVQAQDRLRYDEPPSWYYPVRESLGAALLRAGQPEKAEQVFRKDLELNPGNGRSLFGLWRCLERESRAADADRAKRDFEMAWKSADVRLNTDDF